MSRPKRHAALQAAWSIKDSQAIARSTAQPTSTYDSDDDDTYFPSSSAKRLRTAPSPFATGEGDEESDTLAVEVVDGEPRDTRQGRTRTPGCYVISPLYTVPPPYIDEQTAKARQAQARHLSSPSQPPGSAEEKDDAPTSPPVCHVLLPSGVTSRSPTEPLRSLQARDAALTSALSTLSATLSSSISSLHQHTFTALHQWMTSAAPSTDCWSLSNLTPTAFLYCGVDVDDHPLLFSQLSAHLTSVPSQSGCRCLPVLLSASSCPSIEKAIQHLLLSLISSYPSTTAASSLTLRSQSSSHFLYSHTQHSTRQKHLIKHLWTQFSQWWEDTQRDHPGPIRLLLLITDPHSFDAALLTRLLYVLQHHTILSTLPWCWLLGLSGDGRVVRRIGERVTSRMEVDTFYLDSSTSVLGPVMKGLMLEGGQLPLPVMSGEVLQWLMRGYAKDHTSLASWSTVLRAIACMYYGEVEFSHLTQKWREGQGKEAVAALEADELAELRRLVGEDGVGGNGRSGGKGRKRLTFSDDEYREKLLHWLEEFDEAKKAFVSACQALHALSDVLLPAKVTRDSLLIDAHVHCSTASVESFPLLKSVLQALRSQSSAMVLSALQSLQSNVTANGLSGDADTVAAVVDEVQRGEAAAAQHVSTPRTASNPVRALTASGRRNALLGGLAQADGAREAVRAKVVAAISAFFSSRLRSLASLPLSSLLIFHSTALPSMFSFDQQSAVTRAVGGVTRSTMSTSLPPLSADMADMAIVFRLYQETSGLRIVLYGWFQSFCSIVAPRQQESEGDEKEERSTRRGQRKGGQGQRSKGHQSPREDEDFVGSLDEGQRHELFARFTVCVNALRWCGFVKPASGKRAREEMIRLVWEH